MHLLVEYKTTFEQLVFTLKLKPRCNDSFRWPPDTYLGKTTLTGASAVCLAPVTSFSIYGFRCLPPIPAPQHELRDNMASSSEPALLPKLKTRSIKESVSGVVGGGLLAWWHFCCSRVPKLPACLALPQLLGQV